MKYQIRRQYTFAWINIYKLFVIDIVYCIILISTYIQNFDSKQISSLFYLFLFLKHRV